MVNLELEFAVDGLPLANSTTTTHNVSTAVANDDAPSALEQFSRWYSGVHGYLCVAICVFGIVSNILNIVVLTDRRMASSPTNFILTALAISDLLPMLTYLPYAVYFHCVAGVHPDPRNGYPRAWIVFLLFNNSFIITSHTVSVWLTVTLAVFRYIAVCHHAIAKQVCTLRHARIAAACIVVAALVVCLPTYLMYQPTRLSANIASAVSNKNNSSFGFTIGYNVEIPENMSMTVSMIDSEKLYGAAGGSGYWFKEKEFVGPTFRTVNFWVHGVAFKTAPCILLTVLSALLIRAMRAAELRHRRLVRRPVMSSFSASPRTDTHTCTVRRHHTFETARNPSQSELNGATLSASPAAWRRSFSERITRSTARSTVGEEIQLGKVRSSADEVQDDPVTSRIVAANSEKNKTSTVIAQTVGGDVVVELTRVDDDNSASAYYASDLSIHDDVAVSTHEKCGHEETSHLRVDTTSSNPEYHTFDSDEGQCSATRPRNNTTEPI